ncbi:MAG: ABC transporter ATP-binding protein [Ruminococcus sp.]|nr:ABC transporter ATP-binding protein [Ruminococcus sp.]
MKKTSVVKKVLTYSKTYLPYFIFALIFAIISVSLTLYIPVLVGQAIDNIIAQGEVHFENIFQILMYILVAIAGVVIFQWAMNFCTNSISYKTVRDLRRDIFKKFNTTPLAYIDSHPHGDLISRMVNDVDAIGDGLIQMITQLFSGVVTIAGTIIFMISIDLKIALVVVFVTPLSLFVAAFIGKLSSKRFRKQQELQGTISGYVEELIGNQQIVKSFSYEDRSFKNFKKYNDELYTVGLKAQIAGALANPSTRFVNALVYASVGIFGAITAVSGGITVGGLSCFLTYANQYTKPFNEVTGVLTQLQTAIAAAKRVFEVLEEESETPDKVPSDTLSPQKGTVEFKNVFFSYTKEKSLIENFSLKVEKGQHIAIVGPTGCGKTTMINLLMRFYDVTGGEILVDGVNVKDLNRNELRSKFGMVLQDSWLFNGTIRENLMYGNENATEEQMINSAKQAYAHSFIRRMPKGYDTVISEDGSNLSQGQRQLLCIARAMLSNPSMLILDEATSSIDILTEQRVQKAFAKIMEGRTSFVVAHRLSTIKESDLILVMNDGNIVEQGNHETLLAKNGFYANLYNSQFAKQ